MGAPRVRCKGGVCTHKHEPHWAAAPLLWRARGNCSEATSTSYGMYVQRTSRCAPRWYSSHASAKLLHRSSCVVLVWKRGVLVMLGARALCGAASCLGVLTKEDSIDGLRSCESCDAVHSRREEAGATSSSRLDARSTRTT